jgi:protein-tyrosine kinase
MEYQHYVNAFGRRSWILILFLLIGAFVSLSTSKLQHPGYQSSASLWLNPLAPSSSVGFLNESAGLAPTDRLAQLADTYAAYMKTPAFLRLVAKKLPPPNSYSLSGIASSFTTSLTPNTNLFNINVRWGTPGGSQMLANAIAQAFLASNKSMVAGATVGDQAATDLHRSYRFFGQRINSVQQAIDQRTSYLIKHGLAAHIVDDPVLLGQQQQLLSLQTAYTGILTLLTSGNFANGIKPPAELAAPADLGTSLGSSPLKSLLFAEAVAILLGLGLVTWLTYVDPTVYTASDLANRTGTAVLSSIERIGGRRWPLKVVGLRASNGSHTADRLPALYRPNDRVTEGFRQLALNIHFKSLEKPLNRLVVTSATPAEGKSFVVSNLATTLAISGKRVIVVDGNLRWPTIATIFSLPATSETAAGLSDLIAATDRPVTEMLIQQYLCPTSVERLQILPSGRLPVNPAELLGSERAAHLFETIGTMCDIVLYDTPPLGLLVDASVIAGKSDGVILVARAAAVQGDEIAAAADSLRRLGIFIAGSVLNRTEPGRPSRYYGSSYGVVPRVDPRLRQVGATSAGNE